MLEAQCLGMCENTAACTAAGLNITNSSEHCNATKFWQVSSQGWQHKAWEESNAMLYGIKHTSQADELHRLEGEMAPKSTRSSVSCPMELQSSGDTAKDVM